MRCDVIANTARKFYRQLTTYTYHNPAIWNLDMDLKFVLFFVQLTAVTKAHLIRIKNNCSFTVWPGIQGDQEHEHLLNGGFLLDAYKTHTFNTPRNWAGRIWGRTNCDSQGKCETGDCGKSIWSICSNLYYSENGSRDVLIRLGYSYSLVKYYFRVVSTCY